MLARPQTTPINLPMVAFISLLFCSFTGSSNSTANVTSTTEPTVSTPARPSTSTLAVTPSTPDGQTVPAPAATLDTQNAPSASFDPFAICLSAAMKSVSAWDEIPLSTATLAAYNACMRNCSTSQISSPQPEADANSTLATAFPVATNGSGNDTTPSAIVGTSSTSKSKRKIRTGSTTVARGCTKMSSTVRPSTTTNDIVPRILAAHEARMREKDVRDFGIRVGLGTTATVALLVLFVLAVYRCKIRRRQSQKTGRGGYSSVCYDNTVFRKRGGSDDFLMEDMMQPNGFQNVTLL